MIPESGSVSQFGSASSTGRAPGTLRFSPFGATVGRAAWRALSRRLMGVLLADAVVGGEDFSKAGDDAAGAGVCPSGGSVEDVDEFGRDVFGTHQCPAGGLSVASQLPQTMPSDLLIGPW